MRKNSILLHFCDLMQRTMPEAKLIPVVKEVCLVLSKDIFDYLKRYIIDNYWSKFSKDKNEAERIINVRAKKPSFIWSFKDPVRGNKICTNVTGVDSGYFQRRIKEAKKQADPVNIEIQLLNVLLEKLNYQNRELDKNFFHCFSNYVDSLAGRVANNRRNLQKLLIKNAENIGVERIKETDPNLDEKSLEEKTEEEVIKDSYFKNLVDAKKRRGTKWWIYFYGYEFEEKPNDLTWPLVRLVLTFDYSEQKKHHNLLVSIKNTPNPKHYDYKGETDLSTSSFKVLVLNLRTDTKPKRRQLNIKLFANGGDGDYFPGQYLNYELSSGIIFSGVVMLEMIKKVKKSKDKTPAISNTYYIPYSGEISGVNEEVAHIIPFIKDLDKTFRYTEPRTYEKGQNDHTLMPK